MIAIHTNLTAIVKDAFLSIKNFVAFSASAEVGLKE